MYLITKFARNCLRLLRFYVCLPRDSFFEVLLVCPCFVLEEWFCVHLAVVGRPGHCFSERKLLVLLDVALGPG